MPTVTIIGGGPAGLMAAETARRAGVDVDLYEGKGSVGRKFLIAGKGGLNLTHSEPRPAFDQRYRERSTQVGRWLDDFDADDLREWARDLGIETFVGSSGRVFPTDLKAAPLLRAWVKRLRNDGVRIHVNHRWLGWHDHQTLRFDTPDGERTVRRNGALVLALGGGSWPQLGSDGAWRSLLADRGIRTKPLRSANCGFDQAWSDHFRQRHAGAPIKPVVLYWIAPDGKPRSLQGECVISADGIEGSAIYAISADLRERIDREGSAMLHLDLAPGRDVAWLRQTLSTSKRRGRSVSDQLRRCGLPDAKTALLHEVLDRPALQNIDTLAASIKGLPLTLRRERPVAEAISSAGGVCLESLDSELMLHELPGVFCAGEMLDWEAPTGGYLLTACFASGRMTGAAAARWCRDIGN